jgi:hypothetical protein
MFHSPVTLPSALCLKPYALKRSFYMAPHLELQHRNIHNLKHLLGILAGFVPNQS